MDEKENPDVAEIRRLAVEQIEAYLKGDVETYLHPIADDRILMTPNQPSRIGRKNAAELKAYLETVRQTAEVEIDEIVAHGDWAFERGAGRGTLVPANAPDSLDPSIIYNYQYLRIWNRQNEGWKAVRLIWNSKATDVGPSRVLI